MGIAFQRSQHTQVSQQTIGVTGNSHWYGVLTQITLNSSESDSIQSLTVKMQKGINTNYGQAKLIARVYSKKLAGSTVAPKYWFINQDGLTGAESRTAGFGLAQSEPVLIEGNLQHSGYTDVTFNFTTPFIPSAGTSEYVVVIMPLFQYGEFATVLVDGMVSLSAFLQTSNGFVDKFVKILTNTNEPGISQSTADSYYTSNSSAWDSTFSQRVIVRVDAAASNTAPTNISLSSASIAEGAAANTTVGTLSATDAEGGAMTFSLVSGEGSTDNASFSIVGNALQTATSLNYEAKSSYSVRIRATDAGGLTYEKAFTISVTNVNEAPSSLQLSSASIQENNAVNAVIGSLSVVDPDIGEVIAYSITSGSDKFNISGSQLRASVSFDYEVATSHSVTVRATDAAGLYVEQSFSIAITNQSSDDPVSLPVTGLPMAAGKVITSAAVNPQQIPVTLNGQPLPTGSVIRNTATGQKFVKVDGGSMSYLAIDVEPKTAWGWSPSADALWEILQSL